MERTIVKAGEAEVSVRQRQQQQQHRAVRRVFIDEPPSALHHGKAATMNSGTGSDGGGHITLLELLRLVTPLVDRLQCIASLFQCEPLRSKSQHVVNMRQCVRSMPRGGAMLTLLYNHSCELALLTGDDEDSASGHHSRSLSLSKNDGCGKLTRMLLCEASVPYLAILQAWMFTGEITAEQDPHGEFFIVSPAASPASTSLSSMSFHGGNGVYTQSFLGSRYGIRKNAPIPCWLLPLIHGGEDASGG